jgi:hypothetical protein
MAEPTADFLATWAERGRKVERLKIAWRKSLDAKLKRIAELEEENARYVASFCDLSILLTSILERLKIEVGKWRRICAVMTGQN